MKKVVTMFFAAMLVFSAGILTACEKEPKELPFDIYEWTDEFGAKTNNEAYTAYDSSYDADNFKVKPVAELTGGKRADFMMAVDASMVQRVIDRGGVYYNYEGKEQSVYQILARNGVNYIRLRLWNDPDSPTGVRGGGDCDLEQVLKMVTEARKVNMRFILDLHYSDTWADPERQTVPYAWELYDYEELKAAVKKFTTDSVNYFKERGVVPQMVQIGNEINNGFLWETGKIVWNDETSYDRVAGLIKAGIEGAKAAYPAIKTIVHLAEGGKTDVYDTFFTKMQSRNVGYDIIGVSFYTFYHGTIAQLRNTLNTISAKFNKPIFVAEMSYGYTFRDNDNAANIFGTNQEDIGGYKATIQGQASCIRDTIEAVAQVPNARGIGVCYWEPAWLPVAGAGWAEAGTLATWSNQGLFTYTGKALPSLETFNLVRTAEDFELSIVGLKSAVVNYTLNIASSLESDKKMPSQVMGLSNVDSYVNFDVSWDQAERTAAESAIGTYTVTGTVTSTAGTWSITANVRTIQNFVVNPGFELDKNTQIDTPVKAPWYVTGNFADSTKVQTAKDYHTGMNDLNYYHTAAFNFNLYQDIQSLSAGSYTLSVYIMGESQSYINELYLYLKDGNGAEQRVNLSVSGWANGYQKFSVTVTVNGTDTVRAGVKGDFKQGTWGHIDDFELVKN